MREILEDLARMNPLVLKQEPMVVQSGVTPYFSYTACPGKYVWVCSFCACQDDAELGVYGYPKAHSGDFPHTESCIWQRAKEAIGD